MHFLKKPSSGNLTSENPNDAGSPYLNCINYFS